MNPKYSRALALAATALTVTTLSATALPLSGCSSPSGPIAPSLVDSPATKVTLTPDLEDAVAVPNLANAQRFDYTDDGHLKYQFQLQNKTAEAFFLRVQATFFDDQGMVVDQQSPTRHGFQPSDIKPITVICTNTLGRDVKVQVMPAR